MFSIKYYYCDYLIFNEKVNERVIAESKAKEWYDEDPLTRVVVIESLDGRFKIAYSRDV